MQPVHYGAEASPAKVASWLSVASSFVSRVAALSFAGVVLYAGVLFVTDLFLLIRCRIGVPTTLNGGISPDGEMGFGLFTGDLGQDSGTLMVNVAGLNRQVGRQRRSGGRGAL